MNWKKYLSPTEESAELFLKEMKKFGHEQVKKDGQFLGQIHISSENYGYKEKVEEDSEILKSQNILITQALKKSGFYDMVVGMMDYFYPIKTREINNNGLGCSCGIYGRRAWESENPDVTIMVTIHSAAGCAEGIVHELGHYKLHAVGINLEEWPLEIIGNDYEEVYESPVRFDKLRPMAAVIHAQFSYVYVTKFYIPLIEEALSEGECVGATLNTYYQRQAYNLKRIGNGIHTIREHFKAGDKKFYNSLIDLSEEVWKAAFKAFDGVEKEYDWEPIKGKP